MSSNTRWTLYISVYDPVWGNTPHWSLKVVSPDSTTYHLQIFGEPGTFVFDETIGADPVTASHREDIKVWNLDSTADLDRIRNVAKHMRIDKDTVLWNCQDWCLDVINELEEDLVVDVEDDGDEEDLQEWKKSKRRLVRKMGPEV